MNIKIEAAKIEDVPAILNINKQNLISNKKSLTNGQLEEGGFLIMPYTADLVSFYVNQNSYFTVSAKLNDEVVGYTICCDLTEEKDLNTYVTTIPDWSQTLAASKVLYLSQIAKKSDVKGVGKQLMAAIFNCAAKNDYQYIICQIIHKPVCNKVSVMFHEYFGFRVISEIARDDGKTAGVYLKQL